MTDLDGSLLLIVSSLGQSFSGPGGPTGPGNDVVNTPVITEPRREGQMVSPNDVHMETGPFSDTNPDATHAATDWELWTVAPLQRIWVSRQTSGQELVHVHLADGRFENSHTGRRDLFAETNYRLRVRHQSNFGENSNWAERNFRTSVSIPGDPDLRWAVKQPGYSVDIVATGFQLPVNIAFVSYPGPGSGDPLYYVTELYGRIKVVTNDGAVNDYATNLLNFNPNGQFPGSGEMGVTGIVVDPNTGDIYASMLYSTNPADDAAPKFPKVVRFESDDGGLTAARQTTVFDLAGEAQGASHQISKLSIGPDGLLYVHNGDGGDFRTALNLDSSRGKVLRMTLAGDPVPENPFYEASLNRGVRNYVYAYGLRNPFGGDWRAADGALYAVENGPDRNDRLAKIVSGRGYGWDNTDDSMTTHAIWNWDPPVAPVSLAFIQPETFGASLFPKDKWGHAFASESGPTYAPGPQQRGKRISEFVLDAQGNLVQGPIPLIEYVGVGRSTVSGMAAGPDGLYFTDLYKDDGPSPVTRGANVLRVSFTGAADFTADVTAAPVEPLTVQFIDTSTTAPYYWFWDFGDGEWSEEQYPVHTYALPGIYTVWLYVYGDSGEFYAEKPAYVGVGNVGLRGEYFFGTNFRQSKLTRIDPQLDFNWGLTLPDPALSNAGHSVRWTGQVTPLFTETYNFHTYTGDGVRLWVNNQLLIDKWFDQPLTDYTGTVALKAGVAYDIKMENFRRFNRGAAFLSWSSPRQAREIIPPSQLAPTMQSTAVLAPTGLEVTPLASSRVTVTWNDNSENEAGFKIERAVNLGGFVEVGTVGPNVTEWIQPAAAAGNYSFRVRAYQAAVNSPYSNQANGSLVTGNWVSRDIGAVGPLGSTNFAGGVFTVRGSGADIEFRNDAFQYVHQRLTGNWRIDARVTGIQATDPWAKAGVMVRESLAPNSRHAMMLVTPNNGANFLRRVDLNGPTTNTPGGPGAAGTWVRLERRGAVVTGFRSTNGTTWTQVGQERIEMGSNSYVGLALTSHNNGVLNTSTFDNVSITRLDVPANPSNLRVAFASVNVNRLAWTNNADNHTGIRVERSNDGTSWSVIATLGAAVVNYNDNGPPQGTRYYRVQAFNGSGASPYSNTVSISHLPQGWVGHDIGLVGLVGTSAVSGGVYTVRASGADLWGTADSFRFTYVSMSGNFEIVARVATLQNTAPFAKAGIMMRATRQAAAANVLMAVQPQAGVLFQRRNLAGFVPTSVAGGAGAAPVWVRLVRQGNTVIGSRSANGVNWTEVARTTVWWGNPIDVGLALTANNNGVLNTATFSNVTVRQL